MDLKKQMAGRIHVLETAIAKAETNTGKVVTAARETIGTGKKGYLRIIEKTELSAKLPRTHPVAIPVHMQKERINLQA